MFDYLLMDKYVGDSCKLTIWRDRQVRTVTFYIDDTTS